MSNHSYSADRWRNEVTCKHQSQMLGRYLAPLLIVWKKSGKSAPLLYTGFLLKHRDACLWVTAGHVIEEIRKIINDESVTIIKAHWLDCCGHNSERASIPVDLKELVSFYMDTEGFDAGVFALNEYYVRLFEAGHVNEFLTEGAWRLNGQWSPQGYYLIGQPAEKHVLKKSILSSTTVLYNLRSPTYCLPLVEIPDSSNEEPREFWCSPHSFYGQLIPFANGDDPSVSDIRFMSGGPIFSVDWSLPGPPQIGLIGIQSSWLPESRRIRATRIEALTGAIDYSINMALQELHESSGLISLTTNR
ncbi:hypothetical protein RAS2_05590 [Phycisphaerae bacterium RAS2]|nr:hypothetical protein RAS2_05590 [Phycisphaerae bacterium RAS2]